MLQVMTGVGLALLGCGLLLRGVARQLPWFVGFCYFASVRTFTVMAVDKRTDAYFIAWIASTAFTWFMLTMVTLELFRRACRDYPGIGSFARKLLSAALAVAIIVSVLLSITSVTHWNRPAQLILLLAVELHRGVITTLAIALAVTTAFFHFYPTTRDWNVIQHTRIFMVYLVVMATGLWLYTWTGARQHRIATTILQVGELACLGLWAVALKRPVPAQLRVMKDPLEVERATIAYELALAKAEYAAKRLEQG